MSFLLVKQANSVVRRVRCDTKDDVAWWMNFMGDSFSYFLIFP